MLLLEGNGLKNKEELWFGPDEGLAAPRAARVSAYSHVVESFKEAMKLRNVETNTHMQRMENMSMALAKSLGLDESGFDRLVLLASMHDIGKVAVPDAIINKPGTLDAGEWEAVRAHCAMGRRIAMTSKELISIADEIYTHHERWDGKGYPEGISGSEIPLLSRVINVVSSYDAMTHTRVYRYSISHSDAVKELENCAGTQFDPEVVSVFRENFGRLSEEEMLAFSYSLAEENFLHYRSGISRG